MKFLLCLQFWEGDKTKAMRLARLIAEIEPAYRNDVAFLFVSPDGCPPDQKTFSLVGEKFTVDLEAVPNAKTGWPAGPNSMIRHIFSLGALASRAEAMILIEPDCVLLSRDWIDQLAGEWAKARIEDKWLMGAWRQSGGEHGHINGNGLFMTNFSSLVPIEVIGDDLAWDCAISPYVKDRWRKTNLIRNLFQETSVSEEHLVGRWVSEVMPVIAHGVKDDSAYLIAARILGLDPIALPLLGRLS